MLRTFRLSMSWLHTWFGLVLGFVLMAVFFFGSLSVFDREIDRWALPETRFEPQHMPSFDAMMGDIFPTIAADEDELAAARKRVGGELPEHLQPIGWGAYITHRDPVLDMYAEYSVPNPRDPFDHVHGHVTLDPRDGSVLPHNRLRIGSEFFYPLHYSLHIEWKQIGTWIVGVAALIMLVALVTGVIIHRRLFRELFTFRPHRQAQRSILDLHNLTGVVALPFHFFFALSGLTIFAFLYLPIGETVLSEPAQTHLVEEAVSRGLPFEPAGEPAQIASVDAMMAEAKRRWAEHGMEGEVGFLWVTFPGDRNSFVSIYRAGSDRVALVGQGIHFDAATGQVIHEEPPPATFAGVNEFLTGLHLQHFQHWPLRWFYVVGGLVGCICIATGFIFFVAKRKRNTRDVVVVRWVDALAVTAITGMVVATGALLVANRALPADLPHRDSWEQAVFWFGWLLAMLHAFWRSKPGPGAVSPAWREQSWAIAVMALTAVGLNWITTGDHLLNTLVRDRYWPVAGFDLALLVCAAIAVYAGLTLRRRERAAVGSEASALASLEVARG